MPLTADPALLEGATVQINPGLPDDAAPAVVVTRGLARIRWTLSLRSELLLNLALLATATLVLIITTLLTFDAVVESASGLALVALMSAADVALFLLFGYHLVGRLVLQPLDTAVSVADSIAKGDRLRRMPIKGTPEFARLANAINSMTDQLIADQERLVRAEKLASLGRLAAGVAHEVGNPLGAITGYAHLIKKRARSDEETVAMLSGLEREAGRVDRLMRALLDYGRPRRVAPHAVRMQDTISCAVDLLRNQGKLDRIDLEMKLDESLRPVRGDHHALEQVMVNLLLNAADASPANGSIFIGARIATRAVAEGSAVRRAHDELDVSMPRSSVSRFESWRQPGGPAAFVEVIVADSGRGIDPADRERIFDPFFTTKEPGKGTGLGLALVARTIDDCGGIVLVRRAREGGAAFVLLLPVMD